MGAPQAVMAAKQGDAAMADPVPDAAASDPTPDAPVDSEKAAMAEALAKANAEAKKHRLEAKAHAEALEQLRQQTMTDTEKAINAARDEGRAEAFRTTGSRLVDAEVRAAAAGRQVDVTALLEGLDRSRFMDTDGEPDVSAIQKWIDRIAPTDQPQGRPRVPAGVRDSGNANGDPVQVFTDFLQRQRNKG